MYPPYIIESLTVSSVRSTKDKREVTRVFYGVETVISTVIEFLNQTNNVIYACVDQTRPILTLDILVLKKAFEDAKNRGVKLLYITEITKDNLTYCKQLMKITDELRHLDGIKGNFYISESGYLAPATYHEKGKPASQIIYSNINEIIEHQKYVFDSFWSRSIPSNQKIREIEEGKTRYETRIIENNPDEIIKQIAQMTSDSKELATCLASGGLQYSYNYFFEIKKELLDRQKMGQHKGIRYVTSIDKENIQLVEIYLQAGIKVRHVRNLPPMSFGVSDKQIAATIEKMESGRRVQSLLISNEPLYLKHFTSVFEELWKNGIDAADRIKDIEDGVDLADIEIIPNPKEGVARAWNIIKSAREEVSIMFASTNALRRQMDMGALQLLKDMSEKHGAKLRLLIPSDSNDEYMLSAILEDLKSQCPEVEVRSMDKTLHTRITIVLADRKQCVIIELKDDTRDFSYSAAGLSTYSNSKSIVSSYVSIFESIWKQTELYEQLKVHDKMQKEFINVAAHELRTPIQPILGLSEVLLDREGNIEQYHEFLNTISRNAKRLQQLTDNILDVTTIESQTLRLQKEKIDLNEKISNVINDVENQISSPDKLKIIFSKLKQPIYVQADKIRLYQVISNLLTNSIKFTKEGTISINVNVEEENNQVVITIRDSGIGIANDIWSRLFTKFATKSDRGTGLGLFISKSIVEAHGGRMWAENNSDGKGATFSFSLPIITQ
jgi:nitrogen-specific signal transduction histidine kinase